MCSERGDELDVFPTSGRVLISATRQFPCSIFLKLEDGPDLGAASAVDAVDMVTDFTRTAPLVNSKPGMRVIDLRA